METRPLSVPETRTARLSRSRTLRFLAFSTIAALMVALTLEQWHEVESLKGGLSPLADPWTEADTIRAAEGYYRLGFSANWGLPDLCFGDQFGAQGTKNFLQKEPRGSGSWREGALGTRRDTVDYTTFVYTHYPPGPHWLAGAMTKVFGTGRTSAYRILPVTVGLLSILFLAWSLARRFDVLIAGSCLALFAALPMFTNMMHGLSYQGYALALLLVELGLCLQLSVRHWREHRIWLALAVTGFLQGWMGFDYFFVLLVAPIAVCMALGEIRGRARHLLSACSFVGAGFALAHLLHILQVVGYHGSVQNALADLLSVAQYRSAGATFDNGLKMHSVPRLSWDYLIMRTGSSRMFGVSALQFCAAGVLSLAIGHFAAPRRSQLLPIAGIVLSLVASSGWVLVMSQHSAQHWHFIPRHFFLAFFTTLIAVANFFVGSRRLRDEQFTLWWLAVPPMLLNAALIAQQGFPNVVAGIFVPVATPLALLAYAFIAALMISLNRLGRVTPNVLRLAPFTYLFLLGLCILAEEILRSGGVVPFEFAIARTVDVAPFALLAGYIVVGIGCLIKHLIGGQRVAILA